MESVIVLNKNFQYWTEIGIEKFLRLWQNNKIEILMEREDKEIRGVSISIKMPVIVRLLNFTSYKIKQDRVDYAKHKVWDRDQNVCQFWHHDNEGKPFQYRCKPSEITVDHVTPKCMGGKDSFENCVTACWTCNIEIKRGRTPEQAGLKLVRKPVSPPSQRKGDMVVVHFNFNPNRIAHKYYLEKFLKMA